MLVCVVALGVGTPQLLLGFAEAESVSSLQEMEHEGQTLALAIPRLMVVDERLEEVVLPSAADISEARMVRRATPVTVDIIRGSQRVPRPATQAWLDANEIDVHLVYGSCRWVPTPAVEVLRLLPLPMHVVCGERLNPADIHPPRP